MAHFFVAFLADLGDFHQGFIAQLQPGADGKGQPVDAFGGDVFGKVTESDIQTPCPGRR